MNSIDILKSIYKPYKYTIKGKTTIINTTSGDYVIKKRNNDLKELFNYLSSRDFRNYPRIIDNTRKDVYVYEYIEDTLTPKEQKGLDLINLVSNLHHKTTYFKEVSIDKFQTIYENIDSNINYYKELYNQMYDNFFKEVYHSPSHYLFLTNFYKLDSALDFCKRELDEWYDNVKNEIRQRVVVDHNNLSLEHFIRSDQDYLISWDKFKIDTPVLDLVKLYQNSYLDLDFEVILTQYLDRYPLLEQEKKLFFILISLPPKVEFNDREFETTKSLRKTFDYIFKTEKLIRPYYSNEEKE